MNTTGMVICDLRCRLSIRSTVTPDVTVGEVAPHPLLQGTGTIAEGTAAVGVHAQYRQASEIADNGIDLWGEPDAVELGQVDAEPRGLAVAGEHLGVYLGQECRLGQTLLPDPFLGGLPDGGLDDGPVPDELRGFGAVQRRDRQLGRRMNPLQGLLPVLQVPAIGFAAPQASHRLDIVLEGVGGFRLPGTLGAAVVQFLPLAEDVEHAPAVDEDVVEAQEEPSGPVGEARVPHVEARPVPRVEPLVRHAPPDLGEEFVTPWSLPREVGDLVARHLGQEPLGEGVIADDRTEHRVTRDDGVEGFL